MDVVSTLIGAYFPAAFGNLTEMADRVRDRLGDLEYDTIVGTGLSGALVVPTLARELDKHWAIVRKEDGSHSDNMIEGAVGRRWLFVDDFVDSGATVRRVIATMTDELDYYMRTHGFVTACVGIWEYEEKRFTDANGARMAMILNDTYSQWRLENE